MILISCPQCQSFKTLVSRQAFSFDDKSRTIKAKDTSKDNLIGRVYRKELSFTDVKTVNKIYKCSGIEICALSTS